MRRVMLRFAGFGVEFVDRDKALRQVEELVRGVVIQPIVVFGPEGCGKTAWLKQSAEILRELGFETIYVNPLHREVIPYTDVKEIAQKFVEGVAEVAGITTQLKLANLATLAVRELLTKWRKKRIGVLVDDVFQAIGLNKAETYVKELLGLIEYPPADYEKIIAIVATSEGVTRERIGRHRWADILPMWNMSREGFEELYKKLPDPKPQFEEVWRLAGGNPYILEQLYQAKWSTDKVIKWIVRSKKLEAFIASLSSTEKVWLLEAIEDPDTLFTRERIPFMLKLVEQNLVVDTLPSRESDSWIDKPPPEKDLEIGIGRDVAWQTPLHKEAIRKVLQTYRWVYTS
uniref:AAA family ATPase n=1 Tax=Ignisphaera aggregans TaxID=334771 RepID=A0A7C5UU87_9CREN